MNAVDEIKESLHKNKKRLAKELQQSREVVGLLSKSTYQKLTEEEKKKVKVQLLDICKAIPALAIFLLPGGALLLPLTIKLIPDILPSAFQEDSGEIDTPKKNLP